MKEILEKLEVFKPIKKDKMIELAIPVILKISNNCLFLKITTTNDGYRILADSENFERLNNVISFYYEKFEKQGHNPYDMQCNNDCIFKNYKSDFSITVAINEFIRFFIEFDNFISQNEYL